MVLSGKFYLFLESLAIRCGRRGLLDYTPAPLSPLPSESYPPTRPQNHRFPGNTINSGLVVSLIPQFHNRGGNKG